MPKYGLDFTKKKQKVIKSALDKIAGADTSGDNASTIIAKHKMIYKTIPIEATLERDTEEEVSETLRQFKEGVKAENALRDDNIDPNFYSVLIFNNHRQREAFFRGVGVKCNERTNLKFINGVKLAEAMGIELPKSTSTEAGRFKVNRELLSFCLNPKKQ